MCKVKHKIVSFHSNMEKVLLCAALHSAHDVLDRNITDTPEDEARSLPSLCKRRCVCVTMCQKEKKRGVQSALNRVAASAGTWP